MTYRSLLCLFLAAMGADAENSTQAGRFVVEHPTLLNLGFEWEIRGDANRNATVAVEFRAVGESGWRQALPLVRIGGENVYRRRENLDYTVPDGFAGSILNLQPGTEYECRFQLTDPDGASGQTAHTVRVKTRSEPQPSKEGRTLHVYPPDYQGPRQEPSFTSLLQAYYGAGLGDWSVVWERRAQPGDTILMHAGLYKSERLNYVDPHDDALRWHDVADVERNARKADHDQGGRRWGGDLRRGRQSQAVRRHGVAVPHLRRADDSQHRCGASSPARKRCSARSD